MMRPPGLADGGCIAASTASPLARNNDQALTLVGHVQRIQPQDLARPAHFVPDGMRVSCSRMPTCRRRDLVQRAGHAAARRVTQHVHLLAASLQHAATRPCSGAESLASAVSKASPSRTDMIAMPCRQWRR